MYSQSFSYPFSYSGDSSSSSNSNSPPAPQMYLQNGTVGNSMDYGNLPMPQPMNYHHFQQDPNQMMTNPEQFGMIKDGMGYNRDQYLMDPTQQFGQFGAIGGIPENNENVENFGQQNFQDFQNYPFFNVGIPQEVQPQPMDQLVQQHQTINDIPEFDALPMQSSNFNFQNTAPKRRRHSNKAIRKASTMHQNTSCANCGCRETKLWRRNEITGLSECNACNLYERMKGTKRPEHLWNKPTAKRTRRPAAPVKKDNQPSEDVDAQAQWYM